jgi:peptide/nickel transport system substrate-binding protein
VISLSAIIAASGASAAAQGPQIKRGGSMTVIEQLALGMQSGDPSSNQFASMGAPFFNEIFGALFYEQPNTTVVPGLVASYLFSQHNEVFTMNLKKGIKFSDGTSFNAQAVVFNIKRDLSAGCLDYGTCDGLFKNVTSVTALSPYKVVIKLSIPTPTLPLAFVNTPPDWIGSPAAIASEGAAGFGEHPVGAGPYESAVFEPNSKVVIVKNPHYYIKGEPYMSQITFLSGAIDQSSYAALQSGSAQMIIGITTPSIITQAKGVYKSVLIKNPTEEYLNLNTLAPPFNNIEAREALAYAINTKQVLNINSPGLGQTVSDLVGPGSDEYMSSVPGARTYNLAKAESLVSKLGGLSFTMSDGLSPTTQTLLSSLQAILAQANIKASINLENTSTYKSQLSAGAWQASTIPLGGIDPDTGSFSFVNELKSSGVYAGERNGTLDGLINKTIELGSVSTRSALFQQINEYVLAKNQFGIPLYSAPESVIASKSIQGLQTSPAVLAQIITIPFETMWVK